MDRPSLRDLLKNPANVILVFIFTISLFVGSLFIFRIIYHETEEPVIAMKELDDTLSYYVSTNTVDKNNESAKKIALILDSKDKFNLILNEDQSIGFTGTYVKTDNLIKLYTNVYYNGKEKNDYKVFTLTILEDNSLSLNSSINNVDNYILSKVNSSFFKSQGYNNLSIKSNQISYTYQDDYKETILNNIYSLNSTYSVIKFIDNLNVFYNDSLSESLYNGFSFNKWSLNQNQILNFLLPNINDDELSLDVINNLSDNIFRSNIYFNNLNEISNKGFKYVLNDNKYINTNEVVGDRINNIIKRVYNYQMIGQKLIIDEIIVAYECADNVCRFYPITDIYSDVKNYYDFTTTNIDIDNILLNIDKLKHYTWTFISENNEFYFESIQLN